MDLKHVHGYKSPMVDLLRSNKASTACMTIRVVEVDNKNDLSNGFIWSPAPSDCMVYGSQYDPTL